MTSPRPHDRHDAAGAAADTPAEVPPRGWAEILRRSLKECSQDQVTLVGAGVAFYAFLSLFPALTAMLLAYGLVTDPREVAAQLQSAAGVLPGQAREVVTDRLTAVADAPQQQLGVGLVIALALALWSASAAMDNLIKALNVAYEEDDRRGFVRRRGLALGLTAGALVVLLLLALLASVQPGALGLPAWPAPAAWAFEAVRWLVVLLLLSVALALLYRIAPDRDAPRFSWVSVGAVVALLIWLLATIGFAVYTGTVGSYDRTYGAFAGVVVLLLWLWLSAVAVLVGAEVNAESEMQTARDTTTGPERPLGQRGAVVADRPPPT